MEASYMDTYLKSENSALGLRMRDIQTKTEARLQIWTNMDSGSVIRFLYPEAFFSPEGGVGLVPKRGCLLTLAYYAFPR